MEGKRTKNISKYNRLQTAAYASKWLNTGYGFSGIPYLHHQRTNFAGWDNKLKTLKTQVMYALKNKVQLIGNLGNAPEIKNIESGKKLARFSICTSESYQNAKGEKVSETQWHNTVAWGKLADIAEKYLGKGSKLAIEGKLVNHSYTGKDGNKKYKTEIHITELLLLG